MGMFDKDKEIGNRLDTEFELREPFILWAAELAAEKVDTKIGAANKGILQVSRLNSPDEQFECTTLASAITDKIKDADAGDFPAVVELREVPGRFKDNTLVLQFLRPYGEQSATEEAAPVTTTKRTGKRS